VAYNEQLATRVRALLAERDDVIERKMFGGLAFMAGGNMCCGVLDDELMIRVGPELGASALKRPFTRVMDFTGRPMTGMLFVASEGIAADDALAGWVRMALSYAASLPAKTAGPKRRRTG
jgi:TfoX/Sxy family transcriptional regulator of competence genes